MSRLRWLLLLMGLLALVACFSFTYERTTSELVISMGFPDPWFEYVSGEHGVRTEVNLAKGSILLGLLGLVLIGGYLRLSDSASQEGNDGEQR